MTARVQPLLLGFAGMLLALVLWHAYQDHRLVHAIAAALSQPRTQETTTHATP